MHPPPPTEPPSSTAAGLLELLRRADPRAGQRLGSLAGQPIAVRPRGSDQGWYFAARPPGAQRSRLFLAPPVGHARQVFDPSSWAPGASIDWFFPAPSGDRVALGLSQGGTEDSDLRVFDLASGALLPLRIPHCGLATVAWLTDERGFAYSCGAPGALFERSLRVHRFDRAGDDPPLDWPRSDDAWPEVHLGGRWIALRVRHSWSSDEVLLLDGATLRPVLHLPRREAVLEHLAVDGDRLVFRTDHEAPLFRVVGCALSSRGTASGWRTLLRGADEGGGQPLSAVAPGPGGSLALTRLVDGVATLELDGRQVALPAPGTIRALVGHPRLGWAAEFESPLHPPALYRLTQHGLEPLLPPARPLGTEGLVLEADVASSVDGARVPLFRLGRRAGARLRPTLVTAYGGFHHSLSPAWSPLALAWARDGGWFVQACVRGGGERGRPWHQQAQRSGRHLAVADLEFCLRALIAGGYAEPRGTALVGASNGALTIAACMVRHPQLVAAAIGRVGLYDMLGFHRIPPGSLWVDEFGDPEDPAAARWLRSLSPLHQILPGVALPPFLGLAAANDARADTSHTRRFVSRLRALGQTAWYHCQPDTGHGADRSDAQILDEEELILSFAWHHCAPSPRRGRD